MDSNGLPDEYVDKLVHDFAYDPIRLHVEEDHVQVLYDRRTLERIWETKHDPINPYTRQPFDINRAVPQAELRQQMSQYILENRTLGLEVIPDYTNVLTTIDMEKLLMELRSHYEDLDFHCSRAIAEENIGGMDEEKYWKTLWKKFNLLRLYCQYGAENRETFSTIKGYEYFFTVIDDSLLNLCREYFDCCDYAMELCREVARIVDIVGLKDNDLLTLPENSVSAFIHILNDLAESESEYLKTQSMVLRIYRRMFFDCMSYLFIRCNIYCICVVDTTLSLLMRQNIPDITNEDLCNGSLILKAGWLKNLFLVLDNKDFVNALVSMVIICISRYENLHEAEVQNSQRSSHNAGNAQAKNIYVISMALDQALSLIDSLVTDYPNASNRYVDQKERLQNLDIVREIVRMVELVLSGFQYMEASHFRFGFNIARALYKRGGFSVIRKKDVETFRRFLRSKNVDQYGKHIKTLLQDFIGDADAEYLKGRARAGNRSCGVTNGSRSRR